MVKKHFCDRCGKEFEKKSDEFIDMFTSVSSELKNKSPINQPELCSKCFKGYDKIITETNKKIIDYVKEGN